MPPSASGNQMIELTIPGRGTILLHHLVCDVNGTLALDGQLIDSVAGALLYSAIGHLEPGTFNLLLSIEFIAMVLIGGVSTVSGSIMGAVFITFLPRLVKWLAGFWLFGFISESPAGGFITLAQMEQILFGGLIVAFLIFEPLGLYGIWIRVRNYWKAWPFSY